MKEIKGKEFQWAVETWDNALFCISNEAISSFLLFSFFLI